MKQLLLGGLKAFGRMVGVTSADKSEALLHSEAGARSLLSRRAFIGASAALAATAITHSFSRRVWVGKPGFMYISLHTAAPGAFQAEEASYAGYAPVEIARTQEQWQVARGVARNVQSISFPPCLGGSATISHIALVDHRGRALLAEKAEPTYISVGMAPELPEGGVVFDPFEGRGGVQLLARSQSLMSKSLEKRMQPEFYDPLVTVATRTAAPVLQEPNPTKEAT